MPKEYRGNYNDSNIYTSPKENASFYNKLLGMDEQYYKARNKVAEKYNLEETRNALKQRNLSKEQRLKLEQELASKVEKIEQESSKITEILWRNTYKKATAAQKSELLQQRNDKLRYVEEASKKELEVIEQVYGKQSEQYKELAKEQKKIVNQRTKNEEQLTKVSRQAARQQVNDLKSIKNKGVKAIAQFALKYDKEQRKTQKEETQKQLKDDLKKKQKAAEDLSRWQELYEKAKERDGDAVNAQYYESRIAGAQSRYDAASQEAKDSRIAAALADVVDNIANLGSYFTNLVHDAQRQADDMMVSYQSRVNASLQGSDKNFSDLLETVQDNLAISPVVQMKDVIDNIKEASDQGIVYNIEQRAFLNTISEKIAHTFDAFDSNLTRLIKLQQADTTAARLGMEASLTKLFNSTFNDSSYLSDVYDSVSQAIIDANSQMTRDESAAFEYTLQKWLGSLYSLGLSSETVTQIAQGVNYLATGDVTSLASNTSLQTLVAMSASNAGLDFAQIMLDGIDAETTNKLMESMVMYLKDIAENSDSQVVKSAYGDIFNMSLSDMRAISNMTTADISRISGINMTYGGMMLETQSQLLQTVMRSSLSENMNNVFQNALYGMGIDMATTPHTWTMDKMLQFMKASNIDMNLPFVNVFGSGFDLNTSIVGLLEMGLGLSGAMSLIGNVLGALGSGGGTGLSLSDWGGTEYNQRGTGIGGLVGTLIGGTSSSTYVGNSSSSDMSNDAIATATDDADETSKITNKNAAKNDHQLDDFWNATVGQAATDYFKVEDVLLRYVYEPSLQSLRVFDRSMANYLSSVFGYDNVNQSGRLRTVDYGISQVRSGSYLRVKDNSNSSLSYLSYDSSKALRTVITNSSITTRISNASDIGASMKQTTPTQMSLAPNTTINIDKTTLVNAILEALGGNENNIKLKQFIEGSLQGSTGNTPPVVKIRNEDARNINVNISNYSQFSLLGN